MKAATVPIHCTPSGTAVVDLWCSESDPEVRREWSIGRPAPDVDGETVRRAEGGGGYVCAWHGMAVDDGALGGGACGL